MVAADIMTLVTKELADTLRTAIQKSGLSANELAAKTGVKQTTISGFLRGRDMRLSNATRIAIYLGLELKKE